MLQQPHICHTVKPMLAHVLLFPPLGFHDLVSEIKVYEDVADTLSLPSGRLAILRISL